MIIRSITSPELEAECLKHFDYFNDFKDTVAYLKACEGKQEIIAKLYEGDAEYWKDLHAQNKLRMECKNNLADTIAGVMNNVDY